MFNLSGNLSVDLGIAIEEGKIVDIEIQSLYFDEEGLPKRDTAVIATLTRLFDGIDIQEIPTLKHIQNSDFAVRMQMERFCIGYVKVSNPRILSIVDSMRKRN